MSARRGVLLLLAGLAGLLLVVNLGRDTERMRASRILRLAEARTALALRQGSAGGALVVENIAALRHAQALDPAEVGLPVALAGQYLLLGRWDSAIATYDEALALEPRPEIYLNRGRALLGAGRTAEAIDDFERAVVLAPSLRGALPGEVREEVVKRARAKTGWRLR